MIFRRWGKKPKLGIALAGGGAKGLAHIGVLQALERAGIQPDLLAGTSMGGLISAAYASGLSPARIGEIAKEFGQPRKLVRLADPAVPRRGLFHGDRILAFLDEIFESKTFADLRIPLTLVAVDLNRGQEVRFSEGSLAEAVRATISIPGVFAPVTLDGQRLVDGGVLNNLPVDVVQEMGADVTLAVDLYNLSRGPSSWPSVSHNQILSGTIGELITVMVDSIELLIKSQTRSSLLAAPPDFLIEPEIPGAVTVLTGFDHAAELIAAGERSVTEDMLKSIKSSLKMG